MHRVTTSDNTQLYVRDLVSRPSGKAELPISTTQPFRLKTSDKPMETDQAAFEAASFASTDFRPELSAFKVPTRFIDTTQDNIVPVAVSSCLAAKGTWQSGLVEFAGAPHGFFATDKHRLTQQLLNVIGQ